MLDVLLFALIVPLTAGVAAAAVGLVALSARVWRRLLSTMTVPVTDNRVLYWPLVLAIVWPLLFTVLWLLYAVYWFPVLSEMFFIVVGGNLATLWAGTVIVAVRLMKQWAAARYWRTILSTLILPLTFLLVVSSTPLLLKKNHTAVDYVKFFVQYPYLLADVEKLPATEPRLMVWILGLYDGFGVLYDETDEIAGGHPSENWKKNAEKDGVICCEHRHIIGHFYFVDVDIPEDYSGLM